MKSVSKPLSFRQGGYQVLEGQLRQDSIYTV